MNRSIPLQQIPSNDQSAPYLQQDPYAANAPNGRPPLQTRSSGSVLRRGKTLTRPERGVAPVPLITPPALTGPPTSFSNSGVLLADPAASHRFFGKYDWWQLTSLITTWWAPPGVLSTVGGIRDQPSRQAWREKITLCWIIAVMGGIVGFATMGLNEVFCPDNASAETNISKLGAAPGVLGVQGWSIDVTGAASAGGANFLSLTQAQSGQDISNLFTRKSTDFPACTSQTGLYATTAPCNATTTAGKTSSSSGNCVLNQLSAATLVSLGMKNTTKTIGYSWDQVTELPNYMVMNGIVLNMKPYLDANPKAVTTDTVDTAIRQVLAQSSEGKDATMLFLNKATTRAAMECVQQRYVAGRIDKISPGCFFSTLFLYTSLVVILAVVFVRFVMAVVFNWFLSAKMCRPVSDAELRRRGISPAIMPEGANLSVKDKSGAAPWAAERQNSRNKIVKQRPGKALDDSSRYASEKSPTTALEPVISLSQIGAELFAVCLVTCYSEGEASIRGTLESISNTSYSDSRKLLFVVCDGMVTGHGEAMSTPDICVGMLDTDARFGDPMPMGYIAVGSGTKRENRAMVYAGHYVSKIGRRTPTVVIVKCGMPSEAKDKKAGNRGKRDSQLILMNFFSRVTYNDRMSPLDFDLFRKMQVLMGVTPDYFEVCLMVDADTKVYPDSLTHLVNCMHHDSMIMGVCGETRIANKRQSWVTAIQVYEYFISHHLAKAFESVFGGVTCLPGCFSIYRLKSRRVTDDDWIPILVKPEIVKEYSMSDVTTLHQKNLLLLGEDRFLSTLMLRTFPKRKMMFCPQARCRTIAPDTFSVLLSQRRRWINSTIHNLLELVRVQNLCGTFCFSMQFVIFMDLVGTVVLPVAISLTYTLIVRSAISPPKNFQEWIPLLLLAVVIGLPAILILITTRKVIYVAWMLIYLLALPVWNFILPVYSFWHFDDFSWGETRRVQGEVKSKKHGDDKTAVFDGTSIPLRRWEDWERSRLRKLRREAKRRAQMEKSLQEYSEGHWDESVALRPPGAFGRDRSRDGSDTGSIFSTEEDIWGSEIGGYNEHNNFFPPPPVALLAPDAISAGSNGTIGADELEAMLEEGFDDRASPMSASGSKYPQPNPFDDNHYVAPLPTIGYRQPNSVFGYENRNPLADSRSVSTGVQPRVGQGHAKQRSGGAGTGYRHPQP